MLSLVAAPHHKQQAPATCSVKERMKPACPQLHLACRDIPTASKVQSRNTQQKRRRNWAPKVKTGCLTCRHRHVKCDEAKPFCKHCTSTGRVCQYGYIQSANATALQRGRWPTFFNTEVPYSHAPPGIHASKRERQIFDLLRSLTVKQITGTFNSPFWSTDVLRAAETYPVIFHSSLAMAAMNHRMRISDVEPHTGHEYYAFALQESNTAIQELVKLTRKPTLTYGDREAILLASVLFTGIACLQRNLNQALMHVRKSLELFNQWRFWLQAIAVKRQTEPQGIIDPSWLLHLISYFEFQAFEIDHSIVVHSWKRHLYELPRQQDSKRFASAAEAYYEYMPLHFGSAIDPSNFLESMKMGPEQDDIANFENVYSRWRARFQRLEMDSVAFGPEEKLALSTLRLLVNCERLCRYILRNNTPEVWCKYNARFNDIMDVAEKLLEEECSLTEVSGRIAPTFTFSLSAVEVLRLVGFVSRNGLMRRRVLHLLRKYRRRDGLWDSELSASLIEAKMLLEEKHMEESAGKGTCQCVMHMFVCGDHRGRTLEGEMLGDKVFRCCINSKAGQERGDPDTHVFVQWD